MRDPIINKKMDVIGDSDIKRILATLDTLTPYPWTPRFVISSSKKAADVKFISEAPELVESLCAYTIYLKNMVDDLDAIIKMLSEEESTVKKEEPPKTQE